MEDQWADPRGEYLALYHAGPVYRLLGKKPLPSSEMPDIHQPLLEDVGYHIRAGKHDVPVYPDEMRALRSFSSIR